jgi:hypothetical protein
MPKPTDEELVNRFTYHRPPDQTRVDAHTKVSDLTYALAHALVRLLPEGRNLSLALTHLEDVRMRGNAALACDSPADVRTCRKCDCTEDKACIGNDGLPCHWVSQDLCSVCAPTGL